MNSNLLPQWNRLATLVRVAQKETTGTFVVAIYDRPAKRQEIVQTLREQVSVAIYEAKLSSTERDPVQVLHHLAPQPGEVVCLSDWEPAFPDALRSLDFQREVLVEIPVILICWVTPYEFRAVMGVALNFYFFAIVEDFTESVPAPPVTSHFPQPPRVFVSYSDDATEAPDKALELANRLRQDGIDCRIDRYEMHPKEGWPTWVERQIAEANYVLVVCTENYLKRMRGGFGERGGSVLHEVNLIAQALYQPETRTKFLPVFFASSDVAYLPDLLGGTPSYDLSTEAGYPLLQVTLLQKLLTGAISNLILRGISALTGLWDKVSPELTAQFRARGIPKPIQRGPNPFHWRGGVLDSTAFFNRERERTFLRALWQKRQSVQIVGEECIGKTSLLLSVWRQATTWNSNSVVAYLDLQEALTETLSGWLQFVGQRWGWADEVTTLSEFAAHVEEMLRKGQHPVLCLDNFEALVQRSGEFTPTFFLHLRSLVQRGLTLLTTSQQPLSALTNPGDQTSPFYNAFVLLLLQGFSEEDASDFVTLARPDVPVFTTEERGAILQLARTHPLALQVACYHVLEAKYACEPLTDALRKAEDELHILLPRGWHPENERGTDLI